MRTKLTAIKDLRLWLGQSVLVALTGCNHNAPTPSVHTLYESENLNAAAQQAAREADAAVSRDKLFSLLEESAIERAAGLLDISEANLDRAELLIDQFEKQAGALSSELAISQLANPEAADYRGHAHDRIMMETYKALNALELDDLSDAKEALGRAHEQQQIAVTEHKMEIATTQRWIQQCECNSQFDENAASKDPQFLQSFNDQYAPLNLPDLNGYPDYVNPFSEYLFGLYLMTDGANSSDRARGASVLKDLAESVKGNRCIEQDAELAEQIARGEPVHLRPTTYVIFETGLAPSREETRISFPLILRYDHEKPVKQVNAVFPVLVTHPCQIGQLTVVTSDGESYPTAMICDMDKIVAAEFREELPIVVTATLISSAVSALDLQQVDDAMDAATLNDPLIRSFMKAIRGHVIKDFTHADKRAWTSLPKMFSVAKFPTPGDRTITLTFLDGRRKVGPIHLQDGEMNFVYVKNLDMWPLPRIVGQFSLK
jgi:hypothetical protein